MWTVDVRYLVAARRYEISKEFRAILRLHFEDALQSLDQVNDIAQQLTAVSARTSQTMAELLPTARSFPLRHSAHTTSGGPSATAAPKSFARIWKVDPDGDDADVVTFCAWAAILLHLMVHKAYCILYHPLFKDPAMASNISVRAKYGWVFSKFVVTITH